MQTGLLTRGALLCHNALHIFQWNRQDEIFTHYGAGA